MKKTITAAWKESRLTRNRHSIVCQSSLTLVNGSLFFHMFSFLSYFLLFNRIRSGHLMWKKRSQDEICTPTSTDENRSLWIIRFGDGSVKYRKRVCFLDDNIESHLHFDSHIHRVAQRQCTVIDRMAHLIDENNVFAIENQIRLHRSPFEEVKVQLKMKKKHFSAIKMNDVVVYWSEFHREIKINCWKSRKVRTFYRIIANIIARCGSVWPIIA